METAREATEARALRPDGGDSRAAARTAFASWLVPIGIALAVLAVTLYGIARLDPVDGYDGPAHLEYARILADEGRLPIKAETYQYDSPPGYHWVAVQIHRVTGFWRAGQVLSALLAAGLVLGTWLLARELWPGWPRRWAAAAAVAGAFPVVVRLGTMFHPEILHAFVVTVALLLVVRASKRGWPLPYALAAGVTLGLAALTRETAIAAAGGVALGLLVTRERRALLFGGALLASLVVVAAPWWLHQNERYGSPFYTDLVLGEQYALESQPREFYVSAPVELVTRPIRPAFTGHLGPQFHADFWSDWVGGQHGYWGEPPGPATRVFLSSQSVLGLAFSAVALAGLWFLRRSPVLLGVVAVAWIGFVVQNIRFPHVGGDPIKGSYLLFLSPIFALAAVEAGRRLPRRLVLLWAGLYALSYAGFLATSW